MRIRFFFAWYDLWIGAYYKVDRRQLFICPIPCFCIMIAFKLSPIDRFVLQLEPKQIILHDEDLWS